MEKTKTLILTCGAPGSGKSTYVNKSDLSEYIIISRDRIRFSLVAEDEPYFSRETLVYNTYCKQIQDALNDINGPRGIICDATHLNQKARIKLLDRLDLSNVSNLCILVFKPELQTCIERNQKRTGREFVPEDVITKMYNSYEDPINDDKYPFDLIVYIREKGIVKVTTKTDCYDFIPEDNE